MVDDTYQFSIGYLYHAFPADKFITDSNGKIITYGVIMQGIFQPLYGYTFCFFPLFAVSESPICFH